MKHQVRIIVPDDMANWRLDKAVASVCGLSRRAARKVILAGGCRVNGKRTRILSLRLKVGSTLYVSWQDEWLEKLDKEPEQMPEILHQDDDIAVIWKPQGIACDLPTADCGTTVVDILRPVLGHLYPVHRLDTPVEGVMVFALNRKSAVALSEQFRRGLVCKGYFGLCMKAKLEKEPEYKVKLDSRTVAVTAPLVWSRKNKRSYVDPLGKSSITFVRKLAETEQKAIVLARLITGRTHQARIHLQYIGLPLVNDIIYGEILREDLGMQLYASYLSFTHPTTNKPKKFFKPPSDSVWELTTIEPIPPYKLKREFERLCNLEPDPEVLPMPLPDDFAD